MTGTSRARLARLLLGVLSLAACSGGGGDSNGSPRAVGAASISATLAWSEASGPVDRYRVLVSRNDSLFQNSRDVVGPSVTITGEVGDRVRIAVAAVSAKGVMGPVSAPSDQILFTETGVTAAASSAEEDSGETLVRSNSFAAQDSQEEEIREIVPPGEKIRHDFDGDGAGDLLWEAPEPGVGLRFTSLWEGALRADLSFDRPAGWWVVGIEDLDGDARADLLWVNEAGVIASSSGAKLSETAPTTPLAVLGQLGADEFVIATGDLDGDGLGDLLVEDEVTGERFLWLHVGVDADVEGLEVPIAPDSRLAATGDFDGDGRTDLLWRGPDGRHALHFMNGRSVDAGLEVAGSFEALATGDFDADGDEDLLQQDASGVVGVLLMGARQQPVAWARAIDAGAAWQVGSVGDYDGDGAADVLWLSETSATIGLYWPESAAPDYVTVDPGSDWLLVSFQP